MGIHTDFTVELSGNVFKILQITDTQLIDAEQRRTFDRLRADEIAKWQPEFMDKLCFQYIREAVRAASPDLILMTGDNVYGSFDDNGTSLPALIDCMEGLNIPWAPVFGNHDNETAKGVGWQCRQYESAENCLFRRGSVEIEGNGNYTVGLMRGGELVRVIYMLDSNGCDDVVAERENVRKEQGFGKGQLAWVASTAQKIAEAHGRVVPAFACYHIASNEFLRAAAAGGDSHAFGTNDEKVINFTDDTLLPTFLSAGIDGVFCGHCHINNTSILYENIRWTFGLKTSEYDYHSKKKLGGTLITVTADGAAFSVEHVYTEH